MKKYIYYLGSIFKLLFGISNWLFVGFTFLGINRSGEKFIRLRKTGIEYQVRGKMDIWSVKEACLDCFYEKIGTPIQAGWTIVDIGAGIGEFTLCAAGKFPTNQIYAFEPFAESYKLLETNVLKNGFINVQTFPYAVWGYTGSLLLDLSRGEPLMIHSIENESDCVGNDLRCVNCISLVDCLNHLKEDRVDLLKLDCEGAEYAIFFRADPQVFARIDRIVLEYHEHIARVNHLDLVNLLQTHGYEVRITPNPVHSSIGFMYAQRVPS